MAELKVQVLVDRAGADSAISDLQSKLNSLSQNPVKLTFKVEGLDNVSKQSIQLANAQAKAAKAAATATREAEKAAAAASRATASNNHATVATERRLTAEKNLQRQIERNKTIEQELAIQRSREQQSANNTASQIAKTGRAHQELAMQQEKTAQSANKLAAAQAKADAAVSKSGNGVNQLASSYSKLGVTVANFAKYKLFSAITRGISDSFGEMRKLDDELVTIRKVADATEAELSAISERSYEVGGKYGKSPSDYAAGVAEFSRAGYRETAEALAELSIKAQLVGDMNAETANQFLIATDAAYGFKGSITQLSAVLDGMNAIDNNFATSIEKISAGLGKVAPIASQAHVGVDELAAAIGTITAVTQRSGEEAATALRALFLNIMGDTKTEIEDGAKWTAGEIDGLRDILERYAPAAVRAAEATGQVINPMEAMRGLAQSMREGLLTEEELMQMVTDIGGKLRSSQLLAIVQNWDMYESMLSEYQNAAGSADQEVSKMLDSWSVKAEQLRTSFTKMLSGLADSGTAKSALDMLQGIVKVLDTDLGRAGIMGVAVASGIAGIATAAKAAAAAVSALGVSFGWIALAASAIALLVNAINNVKDPMDDLRENVDNAQANYAADQAELDAVNTELADINKQIDAIQSKGALSIVDKQDLDDLQQAKEDLEAIKLIKEENAKNSQRELAVAATQMLYGLFANSQIETSRYLNGTADVSDEDNIYKLIDAYQTLQQEEVKAEVGTQHFLDTQAKLEAQAAKVVQEIQDQAEVVKPLYDEAMATPIEERTSAMLNAIDVTNKARQANIDYFKTFKPEEYEKLYMTDEERGLIALDKADQLRKSAETYKKASDEFYNDLKDEQRFWEDTVDAEGAYDLDNVETLKKLNNELEAYERVRKSLDEIVMAGDSEDEIRDLVDSLMRVNEGLGSDAHDSLLNYALYLHQIALSIDEANEAAQATVTIFDTNYDGSKKPNQEATDSVIETPVVPEAPSAETYQNLSDAIENATNNYVLLLNAQKEVAATGLITEETFKALEESGYKFSEVLKDDVTGGLWVAKEELNRFTNDTEGRVNQLRGTELDWDKEIDTPEISTEPVDAFTAALQAAQKELSELEKMLSGMGESGDAFRGYSDAYKDLLGLGKEGRTGTNEFAYKFNLIASDKAKQEVGNDAKKAVEFLNDEVRKNLLSGQMDGNELAEYILGKGFKGTEKAFTKMGDGVAITLKNIDWKAFSDDTGIAEDVLKSILGVLAEYDTEMKDVGDTADKTGKQVGDLGSAGDKAASGLKKVSLDDVIKDGAKAGKSVEEIKKQIEDLQKDAKDGKVELEGDTTDLDKKIDKAIKEVQSVTNKADYTVTVDGDTSAADQAISELEKDLITLTTQTWTVRVAISKEGELPVAVDGGLTMADGGQARASGTPTLVGEIDPEIIVDRSSGTWRLAMYPQLTELDSGDIVFNGEQTRAILAGQPTTFSQNVIGGKSYATGSASSKVEVLSTMWEDKMAGPNTDIWLQSSPKPTGSGGGGGGGGGGSGSKKDEAEPIDIVEEWFDYYMEKMQIAIDALSYKLDQLDYELEGIIHPLEETIEDYERLSGAIDRQIELLERQRKAMIDPIQDEIDALEKAKDIEDEQLELAEKKQAVEEARAELQNAQNERNIRYFNAEKGQWEWMADKGRVADAEEAVKDAEKDLADFEYEMYIKSLERQIEDIESVFDDKIEELEKEQMVYDDAIYDLEQKVDLITDKYEDQMYPIEREQGALELEKQGMELEWANATYPYHEPEDSLSKALGKLDGTAEEKAAISDALTKAEDMGNDSYNGIGDIYYGESGSSGSGKGGYTKVTTPKTTEQMYNELLAEMGVRFGASESSSTGIGNVTTTSNATVVDNSGQTIINGITIKGDAESMSLADMLDDAGIHVQRKSR